MNTSRPSCYFCNESFDDRLLQEHLNHCASILEECPNKCGVYIPRKNVKSHVKQCVKLRKSDSYSLPRNFRMDADKEESTYREKVLSLLTLLRSAVKEAEIERKEIMKNASFVEKRLETIETTSRSLHFNLSENSEKTRNSLDFFNKKLNNLDANFSRVEASTRATFDAINYRLEVLQGGLITQKTANSQVLSDYTDEIRELKKFVAEESVLIADIWDDQKKRMNDLKLELEMRCKINQESEIKYLELCKKFEEIVGDLKKQEKTIKTVKIQVKGAVKILEDLLIKDMGNEDSCTFFRDPAALFGAPKGRLLWRIDNYKEKMSVAKENDSVLKSPLFFSKEYGYALQMKLYLNGRDRWRDRNIIGCLKVVEGPWDPLLEWPCILRATVTLRDQDNPANNVKKIVKTKGSGEGKSAGEGIIDMFIPHSVITRYDGFCKNNIIFLDIQVTEMRGSSSMTSLIS